MQPLPIDALVPEIVASLRRAPNLVIEAPPGAGKTTRVPAALLDAGVAGELEVWVLEPRRLATRMAARRVAEERGERVGESVGYQVRFEDVSGARTRLRFLTEGVFTRRLLSDPQLSKVGAVVLDEFHERHLQADLALALLRRLQQERRTDLRIVCMSATLEAAPVARYLSDCPVLRSEGRRFDVEIEYLARHDERPLSKLVEEALRRLVEGGLDGDVLVFLPGAAEIRRAQEACAALAAEADLLVLPLHGDLSPAEQDRAVLPAARRKVILSTNVAETSLTIEGVVAVVDSGLARIAGHSPWSGLPTLDTARISQASAVQRAGRAGRTRAGRVSRLYTAQDFNARPEHDAPEVRRLDLAATALELHAAGIGDLQSFGWFESPDAHALAAAESLLRRLGALDAGGRITPVGARMLRLPLHPRLSRMLIEADVRGVGREACIVAALIDARDIRASRISVGAGARVTSTGEGARSEARGVGRRRDAQASGSPSDLLRLYELFREAEAWDFAPERLRELNLEPGTVRAVERVRRQLERLSVGGRMSKAGEREKERKDDARSDATRASDNERSGGRRGGDVDGSGGRRRGGVERGVGLLSQEAETELLISILSGYPDRVARRRTQANPSEGTGAELLLAGGGSAVLSRESVVGAAEFMVAVDAEERREPTRKAGGMRRGETLVRLASAIEPDWLLDLFAESLSETTEAHWNAQAERVEVVRRLTYDGLVLDERRASTGDAAREAAATEVLVRAALAAGWEAFAEPTLIDGFLSRVEFLARTFPEAGFPPLDAEDARACLAALCEGRSSFAELREAARSGGLLECLRGRLTPEQRRRLAALAPERVTLESGRQARVSYERGKPPWVASRLQDFFGMREAPKVAGGRVSLVLHLLAPSQRPVQVTADLHGFWTRHYPQVRRELSRRYPRHAWPEDPTQRPPAQNGGAKKR